jgi:hypothetical protein
VNYLRQLQLLDPATIGRKSISIIGAGATGSHIALYLAQLGWGDEAKGQGILRVYDFDKVEEHNLPNQAYGYEHIGMQKVDALQDIIYKKCGFKIETHDEKVTNQLRAVTSTYMFLLTDTMASRKQIYEECIKFNFNLDLVVETRMGLRNGRIYAFNPHIKEEADHWTATLYGDDVAEASLCGASASIITTVTYISSIAAGRVLQHYNHKYAEKNALGDRAGKMWNEVQFSLYPEELIMCQFGGTPQIIQA